MISANSREMKEFPTFSRQTLHEICKQITDSAFGIKNNEVRATFNFQNYWDSVSLKNVQNREVF